MWMFLGDLRFTGNEFQRASYVEHSRVSITVHTVANTFSSSPLSHCTNRHFANALLFEMRERLVAAVSSGITDGPIG
jgi:hypothetical protein